MGRLIGYLGLMRPINCLMMGFAVLVGAALVAPNALNIPWLNLVYGFVTGFTLTAASMALNDFFDRNIDAINEPNRPIPSGVIRPDEALTFSLALTTIGFVAAYLANVSCLVLAMTAFIVLAIYTTVGKRSGLPGNFLVSVCVATPFIYGSLAAINTISLNVVIFASMAFLSNTGREVTKGIVDVSGDKKEHIQTLAVRYGDRTAAVVAAIFYLLAVLLSPMPWFLGLVSVWFVVLVVVTDFGLCVSSFMLLKDHSRENARKVKTTVLLWFIVALLAFVVGHPG